MSLDNTLPRPPENPFAYRSDDSCANTADIDDFYEDEGIQEEMPDEDVECWMSQQISIRDCAGSRARGTGEGAEDETMGAGSKTRMTTTGGAVTETTGGDAASRTTGCGA